MLNFASRAKSRVSGIRLATRFPLAVTGGVNRDDSTNSFMVFCRTGGVTTGEDATGKGAVEEAKAGVFVGE